MKVRGLRSMGRMAGMFFFIFMGAGAQQAYIVPYLCRVTPWSRLQASTVIATVYLGMFVFRLGNLRLFPRWSDRTFSVVGAAAYLMFTVSMIAVYATASYVLAIVSAALWGVGAALMWTGTTMQTLALGDEAGGRHGAGIGILYSATHGGYLVGTLLLGLVYRALTNSTGSGSGDRLYLLYVAAALPTLVGVLFACSLPATGQPVREPPSWVAIRRLLARRKCMVAALLQFTSALSYGVVLGAFSAHVEAECGARWLWVTLCFYPFTRMVMSALAGRLSDRWGYVPVLFGGFLCGAGGLLGAAFGRGPAAAMFTACALGILNSAVPVVASALVGDAAGRHRRPLVYGAIFSFSDLGVVTAAVGINILGVGLNPRVAFASFAGVFVVCALLSLTLSRVAEQRL